jgi:hypothetical protein
MFKNLFLASALLLGSASWAQATTLFFDDFNSNAHALNTTPTGWGLNSGSVDIIGVPDYPWYGPGSYIDMNGSTTQSGAIYTVQNFNLVAGKKYTISFDYGNNKNSNGDEGVKIIFGSANVASLAVNGLIPNLLSYSVTFTSLVNDNVKLLLAGFGANDVDNGGVIIDNVRVSTVPLPAALPLFVAGLGALGAVGRRRKQKAAKA